MKLLAVTHFNNETLYENKRWRENNNYDGCIYNSPVKIKESIPFQSKIYVFEMNNDTNRLIGVGIIINRIIPKKHKIYTDNNYNRYTYYGKKWIDAKYIDDEMLIKIEKRLFQGKSHLKRSQGIVQVPYDVSNNFLDYINTLYNLIFV
tara:strand:- start:854 stop:1297 length:444 start_codon:yes stop_codon:yes gene_type:complete